ncbi:MAG TPA: hypothetical protein VGM10_25785 [Actinocrinis sp.]|jgi:hypothetical protein
MTAAGGPTREKIIPMLAAYANCAPQDVPENIDSLGVAWLIDQVERRLDFSLDLDDETLARMSTVDGAVAVLQEVHERTTSPQAAHADG